MKYVIKNKTTNAIPEVAWRIIPIRVSPQHFMQICQGTKLHGLVFQCPVHNLQDMVFNFNLLQWIFKF